MQRHRHRSGQDFQDLPVGRPEGILTRTHSHQQRPNPLALMLQGDLLAGGARPAEGRHLYPVDAQAGERQP